MIGRRIIHRVANGEHTILHNDNVTINFVGQNNPLFSGKKIGQVFLTSHRLIFNCRIQYHPLQSFTFPINRLTDVKLEQPVFGANYIKAKARTQPNDEVNFEMHFKSGGAVDFVRAFFEITKRTQLDGFRNIPSNQQYLMTKYQS